VNGLGVAIPDVSLPDYTSQLNQAFAQADQAAQQHHSTLRNVLGAIGDALLIGNGVQPLYHQQQQQNQLATDMTNYLGDNNAALADAFRVNPTVAAEMFKYMHPATETPAEVKEYQYAKSQGYNGSYMDYLAAKAGPIVANNGDGTLSLIPRSLIGQPQPSGGASGPPQQAIDYLKSHPDLAPQFDQKYGSGTSAKILGGATASTPSLTFR
jgi:hypothetical protein